MLFRAAMGDARPIAAPRRHQPAPKSRKAIAETRRADEQAVLAESLQLPPDGADIETGEELSYRGSGVTLSRMRELRRGKLAVQAHIDLHGLTRTEAKQQLLLFVRECSARRQRCVRVVHGKGLGSGSRGPVLKAAVNTWLRDWHEVLAFCSARPVDGGTGAIYVLLRSGH